MKKRAGVQTWLSLSASNVSLMARVSSTIFPSCRKEFGHHWATEQNVNSFFKKSYLRKKYDLFTVDMFSVSFSFFFFQQKTILSDVPFLLTSSQYMAHKFSPNSTQFSIIPFLVSLSQTCKHAPFLLPNKKTHNKPKPVVKKNMYIWDIYSSFLLSKHYIKFKAEFLHLLHFVHEWKGKCLTVSLCFFLLLNEYRLIQISMPLTWR